METAHGHHSASNKQFLAPIKGHELPVIVEGSYLGATFTMEFGSPSLTSHFEHAASSLRNRVYVVAAPLLKGHVFSRAVKIDVTREPQRVGTTRMVTGQAAAAEGKVNT
jgi:hypothetical protein